MSTVRDLAEWQVSSADIDKKGNVLCPSCLKKLAIVTEYGLIRYCEQCEQISPQFGKSFGTVVTQISLGKESISKGHLKDIQSRVVDSDGNSIKGSQGIAFMKSHEKEYAGRLKSYYDPKI